MKRGAGKWIFPAGAVLGIWAVAQCGDEQTQQTELLLTITSDVQVTEVEIRARNIAYEDDFINEAMGSRDIIAEPLLLLITPSSIIEDRFLVHARGFLDGEVIVAAADVYEFVPNQRVEATLTMTKRFAEHDTDGDGFEDCNHVGCDCNDTNAAINPFTKENCSDRVDNNCSGLPINEGCPCRLTDPPVWCTVLTEEFQDLAGIGACTLGKLKCIDDNNGDEFGVLETNCIAGTFKVEEASNNIDDDCDGTVDEGSPCNAAETPSRECFLGHINIAGEPLVGLPDAKPVGECSVGTQSCVAGHWGQCEGDVPPQRDTETGVGWIELPADSEAGTASQCDGLDNDCDGDWDEEPYFDGDGDGFTVCGTDRVNGGLYSELIDCNDDPSSGGASINPDATEICGNTVDEDCRCDHGDPSTQIGSPVRNVDQSMNCRASETYLNCAMLPRSDKPTEHGVCGDGSDGTTVYYHGYFGDTPTNKGCYTCDEQWGVSCSAASQLCATKDEDCAECNAATPTGQADEPRPYCTLPGCSEADCPSTRDEGGAVVAIGCTGTEPPVWTPIVDSDPNDDCPQPGNPVECAGYYCNKGDDTGVENHGCYEKTDPTPAEVDCIDSQSCEDAADLCSLTRPCEEEPIDPVDADGNSLTCVEVESGCHGTTRPTYTNQANNVDWFNECSDSFTCSNSDAGLGPFYYGVRDDTPGNGQDDPHCYYRADVPDSWCNGSGACQNRADACSTSDEGAALWQDGETDLDDRPLCQRPLTDRGCGLAADGLGASDPLATPEYDYVSKESDPYDDCIDGTIERTCNNNGTCHRLQGEQCDAVNECEPGLHCADGYCCDSECLGECQSCAALQTGGSNGVCSAITAGTDPDAECNAGGHIGFACNGGSCATSCSPSCSTDESNCEADNYCDSGGNCAPLRATGEQSDPACAGAVSCSSPYAADGFCCNSACTGACQSCAALQTGGSDGYCSNIRPGTDPDAECNAGGHVGFACNGGSCATSCNPTCSIDVSNCEADNYCDSGGNCAPLRATGEQSDAACAGAVSCSSPYAADGFCCNTACTGECRSCAVAGQEGTCADYTGAEDEGTCTGTNSFCCSGRCVYPTGTPNEYGLPCGSDDCSGGTWGCTGSDPQCSSFDSPCDGYCVGDTPYNNAACTGDFGATCAGSPDTACDVCIDCQIDAGVAGCTPYGHDVDDDQLPNTCVGPTNTCNGDSACRLADGQRCGGDLECASGFCRDGFCCADTCGGVCRSCDRSETGSANDGVCGVVIDGTDPREDCNGDGSQPGLACNGGSCATSCTPACDVSNDCETATHFCDNSASCASLKSDGDTPDADCGAASCSSGSAADGVCCDSPCLTKCQSCLSAITNETMDGICSDIVSGTMDLYADPELCDDSGAGCATNGCACDGSGVCLGTSGSTTCADGSECLTGTCIGTVDPNECG